LHYHHAPGRRGGVDVLRQRPETSPGLDNPLHDVQHVFQRSGQPVELPDDDGVALAKLIE